MQAFSSFKVLRSNPMLSSLLSRRKPSTVLPVDLGLRRRQELHEKFRAGIGPNGSNCAMTEAEVLELIELEAKAAREQC